MRYLRRILALIHQITPDMRPIDRLTVALAAAGALALAGSRSGAGVISDVLFALCVLFYGVLVICMLFL